jgi:hypothetical protein
MVDDVEADDGVQDLNDRATGEHVHQLHDIRGRFGD